MAVFAARYARAFADAVQAANLQPEEVTQQLTDFVVTFDGSKDLTEILLNPTIPAKKRVAILDAVNAKVGCSPKVRNFLAVLISHERLGSLKEIVHEYQLEMNRRQSIKDAEIVTARPLEEKEQDDLASRIAELAGTRVNATFRQDASLLGGAVIRIGSTIYDGSVRGRLERLKEKLVSS